MSDLIFYTSNAHEWRVEALQGRFAVVRRSNERMRLDASGGLHLGESAATEIYWFLTREWAELHAKFCNATERIAESVGRPPIQWSYGALQSSNFERAYWSVVHNGQAWLTVDSDGTVTHISPVWAARVWFNTLPLRAWWNRLMWGERGRG